MRPYLLAIGLIAAITPRAASRQTADSVEAVLRRVPTHLSGLEVVWVHPFGNTVTAGYNPAGERYAAGMPVPVSISVESYDSDADAERARRVGSETQYGPTRQDTVRGAIATWWGDGQVVARVGHPVVVVSAAGTGAAREAGIPFVRRAFEAIAPELERIAPTRPPVYTVEAVLRRLPTKVPALAVVSVRPSSNWVNAVYANASSGSPEQVRISVTSFDSEGAAEEGRRRSAVTQSGPTRAETVRGEMRSWWGDWQVVARVGRHVVSISTNAKDPTPASLVEDVLATLVPDLETIVPTRPARPWALYGPDAIEIFPPRIVATAVARDYLQGATIQGAAFDLNGDGVDDYFVRGTPLFCAAGTEIRGVPVSIAIARSPAGGCALLIYDGKAGKPIGTLIGNPIVVRAESVRGWPVIEAYTHVGEPEGTVTSYVFDGASYVVRSTDPLDGPAGRDRLAALEKMVRWQPGR